MTIDQDWTAPSGQDFKTGDVIAWNLDAWLADPDDAAPSWSSARPSARRSRASPPPATSWSSALYENVRGAVYVYEPNPSGEWSRTRLDLPAERHRRPRLGLASSDDQIFVSVAGYLTPSSLYLADAATGADGARSSPCRPSSTPRA